MCAGAIQQARLSRVIFGCRDPKGGAVGSLYEIHKDIRLNHRYQALEGLFQEDCSRILSSFFASRRKNKSR